MYGGFEQVGYLGIDLPRNDAQTVTQSGDIVLYSGDQIVVFYGSNSWAYTRLGHIIDKTDEEMAAVLDAAIENGINYFDLASSVEAPWHAYAEAFVGRWEKVFTQMHFGALYKTGEYGWTRDLDEIKEQIAWNFRTLKTDYTDFGFIHCVDDMEDLDEVLRGGLWDYMKSLKADGVIRHLGFSSHDSNIARHVLNTGHNVGLINKYYDLARVGDELAHKHYLNFPLHVSDCLRCGHCESRCPFHVKQEDRMREIAEYFVSCAN